MASNKPSACVKIAACICGKDGVISQAELTKMFELTARQFPKFNHDLFENAIDEFFDSEDDIEDLLLLVDDENLREFTLHLSAQSAAADGLNPKENIALEKACEVWGIKYDV